MSRSSRKGGRTRGSKKKGGRRGKKTARRTKPQQARRGRGGAAGAVFSALHPQIRTTLRSLEKAAPDAAPRSLRFTLMPSTVQHVRVKLDYTETVMVDGVSVDSKPRPSGRWVVVSVEMIGNAGSVANIQVTNASPSALTCTVIHGPTAIENRVVVVT